jgi:protein-disulfide isomerase
MIRMMPQGVEMKRRHLVLGSGFLLLAWSHADAANRTAVSASSLIRPSDPVFGNPRGKVTIVDFYDIRCPPCRAMDPRFQRLLREDHDVRYVPVDYPLLGAASVLATEALFAAQEQGKYAEMRVRLLTQAPPPNRAVIQADAKALGLDWPQMELEMSGDTVAQRIASNMARGKALGIKRIPTMFIGTIRVPGALSYSDLVSAVKQADKGAH